MKHPTIEDARKLAKQYGKCGVIILHFDDDGIFGTSSYGKNLSQCRRMGSISDRIVHLLEMGKIEA